jgi:hypothetical protein
MVKRMTAVRRRLIRRVLKWGGLGLSLVILGAWTASSFWCFGYELCGPGWGYRLSISDGHITCGRRLLVATAVPFPPGWYIFHHRLNLKWSATFSFVPALQSMSLPLWMPLVLVAVPTAVLWWRDRRRVPPGHCQRCGYDLTGNTSGICPECGSSVPKAGTED